MKELLQLADALNENETRSEGELFDQREKDRREQTVGERMREIYNEEPKNKIL